MLSGIGPTELLLILVIVLIVFGAGRLPQVLEQMGRGVRAFKEAQREEPIDVTRATPSESKPALPEDALHEAHEVKEKSRTTA
jgi:sec-independent protein translocase protein TatA